MLRSSPTRAAPPTSAVNSEPSCVMVTGIPIELSPGVQVISSHSFGPLVVAMVYIPATSTGGSSSPQPDAITAESNSIEIWVVRIRILRSTLYPLSRRKTKTTPCPSYDGHGPQEGA